MSHSHAIVWMDSKEAHVFQFSADDVERQRIKAALPFRKIHHKAGVIGAGHVHLDHHYFDEIAKALDGAQEWLLSGPSAAKEEFRTYLKAKLPELDRKLFGIEAADHPSDGQLLDHARRFFRAADRLQPNSPARARG
jgi:stalled ribosome rescue protein Dom34